MPSDDPSPEARPGLRPTVPTADGNAQVPKVEVLALLLTVIQVGGLLGCSVRHIQRLNDAGRMPRPVRLGHLVRWRRTEIEAWIKEGCPSRVGGGG